MIIKDIHPVLTFAVFAYNQEQYIAEAVQGALSQTYAPLEVILSDDCSSDRTFEIMQELASAYDGHHKVIVRQNEHNLGLGAHINRVMELAHGQLIVAAAGDDISLPHRTERLWNEYLKCGRKAYSIFSNEYLIDGSGNKRAHGRQMSPDMEKLTLDWFVKHQASITGSSHVWHRDVFDVFGPLGDGIVSEDVAIPFRSLLLGSISYIHEPLVLRRYTGENLSMGSFLWWDPQISVGGFRKNTINHAMNFLAIYQTRLQDLDLLMKRSPERQCELTNIREITEKKLYRLQAEVRFWQLSFFEKIQILLRDFIPNGFRTTAVRLFLSWVFPFFYMRWYHLLSIRQRGKLSHFENRI